MPTQDLEHVYDEQISPLMAQIIAVCKEYGLPFVASFEYAPDAYCSSQVVPKDAGSMMHAMSACVAQSRAPFFAAYTITTRSDADGAR